MRALKRSGPKTNLEKRDNGTKESIKLPAGHPALNNYNQFYVSCYAQMLLVNMPPVTLYMRT